MINLIKASTSLGVMIDGTELGPDELEKKIRARLDQTNNPNLQKLGETFEISAKGVIKDKTKDKKDKNLEEINKFNEKLYNTVRGVIQSGNFPIILGGDHSLAIGSTLASIKEHEKLGILWIDAHTDFNDFDTTVTGNIHGLPLAVETGFEKRKLADFHDGNFYDYRNTVVVGARSIDELEKVNLEKAGVTVFSTKELEEWGAEETIKKAMDIALNGKNGDSKTNGVHISYDIDLIDPIAVPGVSVAEKDGPSLELSLQIVDEVLKYKEKVKAIDVVELNPLRDVDSKALEATTTIVEKFLDII